MKSIALTLVLLSVPCLAAAPFKPGLEGKKLISYGADWPNTEYVKRNIRAMETHPFDGIVIGISESREPEISGATMGCSAWGKVKLDPAKLEHAIDDLKATKWETFTDNFLQVEAMPGDVDWFADDQFDAVVANFRTLARIARLGGCVGLEFDPEEYGAEHVWTPAAWDPAKRKGRSEDQYVAQAIARGQQLMRAINAEFPGIKILCLFGPSLTLNMKRAGGHEYALLAPFLEGMCRAADDKTQIIDGFETSYGYRTSLAFEEGRKTILEARDLFSDKLAFDRGMRVGFGLWLDNSSGQRGWFPNEPEKNHFQPATWQTAVHSALSYSHEYVWVWREQVREWEGKNVGALYEDAQRAARSGPGKAEIRRRDVPEATKRLLGSVGGREWNEALGKWLETHSVLLDLTTPGWEFCPDRTESWSSIEIGKFWEEQGWDMDGVGWYRRRFDVASVPAEKIELVFGGCDESADVFLNGEKVGAHDEGEAGWDRPFAINLTGKVKPGVNELLVKVTDVTGPGGIWKPAAIFRDAPVTTKTKKLIEYGWDCPDTAFVRAHAKEMERRPFDGVVIRPTFPATQPGKRTRSMGRTVFQRDEFDPADYQHCIDDLAATKWEKFTDNFIQVLSQPGDVDWFDSNTDSWINNAATIAKIARAGRCVGLMFDPEQYGPHKLWDYDAIPASRRQGRTLEQYRAQARTIGDHMIRAINGQLPGARILCLLGPSYAWGLERGGRREYNLLAAFVEGMCRGADAGTEIIDGCEQSYMYRTRTSFRAGRRDILLARQTFVDHALFDRVMHVGFGLWMDNGSDKRPWDLSNFVNNYFRPETWQDAIHYGLEASDEYVWIYTQQPDWWTGEKLPSAYEAAQRAGRDAPATQRTAEAGQSHVPPQYLPHAPPPPAPQNVLIDLTGGQWRFATDPDDVGVAQRWFDPAFDAMSWQSIKVGKFWEEQGIDYDGYGWYRTAFRLPARAKTLSLNIGAADESATVWLNGHELGTHDLGEFGWDKPFSFDVTRPLTPGADPNVLVIRVLDRSGAGGLWKSVTLTAGR